MSKPVDVEVGKLVKMIEGMTIENAGGKSRTSPRARSIRSRGRAPGSRGRSGHGPGRVCAGPPQHPFRYCFAAYSASRVFALTSGGPRVHTIDIGLDRRRLRHELEPCRPFSAIPHRMSAAVNRSPRVQGPMVSWLSNVLSIVS